MDFHGDWVGLGGFKALGLRAAAARPRPRTMPSEPAPGPEPGPGATAAGTHSGSFSWREFLLVAGFQVVSSGFQVITRPPAGLRLPVGP